MSTKLSTYFWYFIEYLKKGDIHSIFSSINYTLFRTSHRKDRIIQTRTGRYFCRKNTNDFQFANFRYEWPVKKFIMHHMDDYSVFIDGGACIGEYCIWLAQENFTCYAFEPMPSTYEVLLKNIELNELDEKVIPVSIGLSNKNSKAGFKYDPVNTGASHQANENEPDIIEIELKEFDFLCKEYSIPSNEGILMKLDLEGMELEALEGAKEFIKSCEKLLLIIEVKHSVSGSIINFLNEIGDFEIDAIDQYNIYAKKKVAS